MRSLLFVPGDSERKLAKALDSGADVLIPDLEDSVSPEFKGRARGLTRDFLEQHGRAARVYVRVNDLRSGLADADLEAVMGFAPAGIMLPKAEGGPDIDLLSAKLRRWEAEHGLPDGQTRIVAIATETPAALLGAVDYRGRHRLDGLSWGAEDLSAAVGAWASRDEHGRLTDLFRLARAMTLLWAGTSEVPAIDTVFTDLRDLDGLHKECRAALRDGFTAKLAIHPAQVPVINEAFTPAPEAVAEAEAVVAAFAQAAGAGVVALGGKMLDRPHLRRAERLLKRLAALRAPG